MTTIIHFTLNGKPVSLNVDEERMLLWVLRTDLALTGTKYGCGEGLCGACTVLVNEEAVPACQTAVKYVAGADGRVTCFKGCAHAPGTQRGRR